MLVKGGTPDCGGISHGKSVSLEGQNKYRLSLPQHIFLTAELTNAISVNDHYDLKISVKMNFTASAVANVRGKFSAESMLYLVIYVLFHGSPPFL
jgi:hypothetical protein